MSDQRQHILTKNRIGPKAIIHGSANLQRQWNWLKFGIQVVHTMTY